MLYHWVRWSESAHDLDETNIKKEKAYSDNWLKDLVDEEDLFDYRTDEEYQEDARQLLNLQESKQITVWGNG